MRSPRTPSKRPTISSTACKAKLACKPLDNVRESQEATRFVKTLSGLVRMLEKPDTKEALDQLRLVKTTTLGNLIAFMHVYNLRFGAGHDPPPEADLRPDLPALDDVRDRIIRESKVDETATAQANPNHVSDFFNKLDVDQARAKTRRTSPSRPTQISEKSPNSGELVLKEGPLSHARVRSRRPFRILGRFAVARAPSSLTGDFHVVSSVFESQQAGQFGDGLDQLGMRVGLELAPAVCAAGYADNEPAARTLAFLKVSRRITDLRNSSRISDLRVEPSEPGSYRDAAAPLDLVAADGRIDQRAF